MPSHILFLFVCFSNPVLLLCSLWFYSWRIYPWREYLQSYSLKMVVFSSAGGTRISTLRVLNFRMMNSSANDWVVDLIIEHIYVFLNTKYTVWAKLLDSVKPIARLMPPPYPTETQVMVYPLGFLESYSIDLNYERFKIIGNQSLLNITEKEKIG